MLNWGKAMGTVKISEWLWRFLAAVMLFAVGWTLWIFYQLNAPAIVTNAAFEAAAQAKAKAGQSAQGVIVPAGGAVPVPPAAPTEPAAPPVPKEAPINADKLKFSDSLSSPEPAGKQ
jgi:hypothetical protein